MTRQEVIFEQRLRLAVTIVYLCLATANIILKWKEKKAAPGQKPDESSPSVKMPVPCQTDGEPGNIHKKPFGEEIQSDGF